MQNLSFDNAFLQSLTWTWMIVCVKQTDTSLCPAVSYLPLFCVSAMCASTKQTRFTSWEFTGKSTATIVPTPAMCAERALSSWARWRTTRSSMPSISDQAARPGSPTRLARRASERLPTASAWRSTWRPCTATTSRSSVSTAVTPPPGRPCSSSMNGPTQGRNHSSECIISVVVGVSRN